MTLSMSARRRLGVVLAVAAALVSLGSARAMADPVAPPIPRGMQQVVDDVLGPQDPGFWNPAVPGTRVLTPVGPGVEVACAVGFEPTISCSTLDMRHLGSPQRDLAFVDVPVIGRPPVRVWFDRPQWGDGPTGEWTKQFIMFMN